MHLGFRIIMEEKPLLINTRKNLRPEVIEISKLVIQNNCGRKKENYLLSFLN